VEGQLTLEADSASNPVVGGRGRLDWLSSVENLDVPEWTRGRAGQVTYGVAVAAFLVLTVVLRDAPGPGWLIILPVYAFIVTLALCVAVPRRAE
jgi:hypothetical protein